MSGPSAISGGSVTFVIDSTEAGSTFRCSVDSPTLQPCAATNPFAGLATGQHVFRAAARDAAGNEDLTPLIVTWNVDNTALDTTITAGPGMTTGPNVTFTFTSTRAGTFECILEPVEAAFTTCATPKVYGPLPERAAPGYTFRVRAKDTAGNLDATPAASTFMVDATGPVINITAPTAAAIVGPSTTLSFSMESGSTFTCQLDSQPVITGCVSPRTFSGMTSVTGHTFKVVGTDSFGNSTTQSVSFTVDDVGPGVTVSGNPLNGASVNNTAANLSFAPIPTNEPLPFSFECKFDAATVFTSCTGLVVTGLAEGNHSLQVRGRDRFGNLGTVVTHTWNVTPLVTTIFQIRTTPVAVGTRVKISPGVQETAKTFNRFWVQEVNGNLASANNRGITVQPTTFPADALLVPGRAVTVNGTVAIVNGNTTLIDASYVRGTLNTPYVAKNTGRDSLNLLLEANEGMYVNMAGRASNTAAASCQNYDFCIVSCDRLVPVINSVDAVSTGALVIGQDHNFSGIVEGEVSGYNYFVVEAQEQNDACL